MGQINLLGETWEKCKNDIMVVFGFEWFICYYLVIITVKCS